MEAASRITRVENVLKKEVAGALAAKVTDPEVAGVTVLWVRVSRDLSYADVYVCVAGGDEKAQRGLAALNRCRAYVQRLVAPRLTLRKIPQIRFRLDKQFESAMRVYDILRHLEEEHADGEETGSGGA